MSNRGFRCTPGGGIKMRADGARACGPRVRETEGLKILVQSGGAVNRALPLFVCKGKLRGRDRKRR
jgi:hypothetical protein